MAIVMIKPDCQGSPRNRFLKDVHVAVAQGNTQNLEKLFPGNIAWQIVGRKKLGDIERFNVKEKVASCSIEELTIETVITDGLNTCVSGTVRFNESSQFSFSNIVGFKNSIGTKIESIETFMIKL